MVNKPRYNPAMLTPAVSKRSGQGANLMKQLQRILGPRVATKRNILWFFVLMQTLIIVFLCVTILAKNRAIEVLKSGSSVNRSTSLSEFRRFQEQFLITASRQDKGPFMTLPSRGQIREGFGNGFRSCVDSSCTIDHWSVSNETCFFRNDRVKDRRGHNATTWSLVQNEWYYTEANSFACPAAICRKSWFKELNITKRIAHDVLRDRYRNDTEWELDGFRIGNQYVRVNPFWGLEYKLNGVLTLKRDSSGQQRSRTEKMASVTVRRGLTQNFCDVSLDDKILPKEDPVYIIVPYSGRADMLRKFYKNIKELLDNGVTLRVILAVFGGDVHIQGAQIVLSELRNGLTIGSISDGHAIQIVESKGDLQGNFSRAQALYAGALHAPPEALLFLSDVDVQIEIEFFDNCRYNTESGHQVYYPALYSLYPYGDRIAKDHGYWRKGAFGVLCVYNRDFSSRRTWESEPKRLSYIGWGQEDVQLHREFTNVWKYTVFHAVEPNLIHRWHPQICDFNMNVAACLDTVFQNMGSQKFLASIIAKRGTDVRAVSYEPIPIDFSEYKNDTAGSRERRFEIPLPESRTDKAKMQQLKTFFKESVVLSDRDRMLRYLSENVLSWLEASGG